MTTLLVILIGLALVFDFLNGFHDSSNLVATIISSRAMSPRMALTLTAIAEFVGPFIFGVAVASTIGEGIVPPHSVTLPVLLAALTSAILWNLITWFLGIPSSSSHAMIGGLIGAVAAGVGFQNIQLAGLTKIFLALFLSPVLGLLAGYLLTRLVYFLARRASPKINVFFKRAQIVTAVGLALSHGANDAQKTMGIITLGLVTAGSLAEFKVPIWVVAISAGAMFQWATCPRRKKPTAWQKASPKIRPIALSSIWSTPLLTRGWLRRWLNILMPPATPLPN